MSTHKSLGKKVGVQDPMPIKEVLLEREIEVEVATVPLKPYV